MLDALIDMLEAFGYKPDVKGIHILYYVFTIDDPVDMQIIVGLCEESQAAIHYTVCVDRIIIRSIAQ